MPQEIKALHNWLRRDQKVPFPTKARAGEDEETNQARKEFLTSCRGQGASHKNRSGKDCLCVQESAPHPEATRPPAEILALRSHSMKEKKEFYTKATPSLTK